MSALFYILILATFSASYADQELQDFAQKILDSLQSNLVNTPKGSNSPLLSLTNGEHLTFSLLVGANKTEKIAVNVTFSGTVSVSAQKDTKKVALSVQYGGGAALRVDESESGENEFQPPKEFDEKGLDGFLEEIYERHIEDQSNLDDDETGVLLGHAAGTDARVRAGKRRAEAKVGGGFVVGVKTKVTKNFQ